jgi:hypothetical protein
MVSVKKMVLVGGKDYQLEYDLKDSFVANGFLVAYSDELAANFLPIIYDPRRYGGFPYAPEIVAYRLIVDLNRKKLCILYEVYWIRQDCTWMELNKDHDHDYEQIQIHFNLATGVMDKVVVSSTGPIENGGHGVEVFSNVSEAKFRTVLYMTSSDKTYPWGGKYGQSNATQIRDIPIKQLSFENRRPLIVVLNCYHAFAGLKRLLLPDEKKLLNPELIRLDSKLLERWYYLNAKNRFGHDLSKPFDEPHIMYFPPPEDWISRIAYSFLWFFSSIKRAMGL